MTTQLYSMNPETHRIVPIEPTQEMLLSMDRACQQLGSPLTRSSNAYQAAILAAPQPSPLQSVTAERVRELADQEFLMQRKFTNEYCYGTPFTEKQARLDLDNAKAALNAAIEQMAVDAERYRWLRDESHNADFWLYEDDETGFLKGDALDRVIDARAAQLPKEGE